MSKFLSYYHELEHIHLYRSRFVGSFVRGGRRGLAERLYIHIFFALKKKGGQDPLWLFSLAIVRIRPLVYLKPRKLGGVISYIGLPVMGERKKAIHTIICLARSIRVVRRVPGVCSAQVAEILYDASRSEGLAIDQKREIYRKSQDY